MKFHEIIISNSMEFHEIRGRVAGAGHSFFSRAKNSNRVFCLELPPKKLRSSAVGRNKALRASTLPEAVGVTRIIISNSMEFHEIYSLDRKFMELHTLWRGVMELPTNLVGNSWNCLHLGEISPTFR